MSFSFIQLEPRWEEEAEKLAEDARHRLEAERRKSEEEEEGGGLQREPRLSDDQIEKRLEERLREAQVERETRQRELIQQVGLYFKSEQQSGKGLEISNIWLEVKAIKCTDELFQLCFKTFPIPEKCKSDPMSEFAALNMWLPFFAM